MNRPLPKFLLLFVCLLAVTISVFGQETTDNATYYYNNFETSVAGNTASLGAAAKGNATRGGVTNIDASTLAPLNGNTSLISYRPTPTNGVGYIRWSFAGSGSGIDLNQNDWEWNFTYRNNSFAANDDPDQMTTGYNAWKFWLVANTYAGNNTLGYYVTHSGTTLSLRYRYGAGVGQYNTIMSYTLANNTSTYMIKIQRLKNGAWSMYLDPFVAGMTTAKTAVVTASYSGAFNLYYYSYLESTCTANYRFQWDDFNMYTRVLQFTATGANSVSTNNITPSPLYPGQSNVIMFGVKVLVRGNFNINQLVFNTMGAAFEGYFNGAGTLYRTTNTLYNTSTATSLGSITLTGNAAQDYSLNENITSSGNTDGTYSTPGYYFLTGNVLGSLNYGSPPTGTITFNNISTVNGNGNSSAVPYSYTGGAGNTMYFLNTVAAPTAASVSSCGPGSQTITASGGLPSGGTYNWYNVPTGGTALQSTTSNTYTAYTNNTTTYYVSYTIASNTSARTAVTATVNPAIASPVSGSVFSYPFSGNTTDISGAGNTGINGGATLTTDRFGAANSAYSFNGSSSYITTTTQFVNPTVFTISIWFNTTVAGGKLIGFGGSQTGLSGTYDRQLYMSSTGQLYFGLYNGGTNVINTTASYNDGNWHHVVVTVGSDGSTMYVDGSVQAANSAYTTPQVFNGYWRIGYDNTAGWPNSYNTYFNGKLDDIAVYSRELTSAEISSTNNIYQLTVPTAAICQGSPITFGAPLINGATYTWQDPGGNTVTGQNPTFASALPGNYTLTVSGTNVCTSTATVTPNVLPAPSASFTATSPVTVNSNSTVTFTGTYVATSTYSWNFGGGSPSTGTGQGPFAVQWTTTGAKTITLTVTNASGCSTTTTQTVNVTAAPAITSYGNYAFNRTITLNTTSAGITTNLSNFPALLSIQLNDLIIAGKCTDKIFNPNGPNYDFAFIDPSSATELYYQVESYNQTTGTLLVWVQIPSISYAQNNTLTFYYGSISPPVTHNTAFFQKTWTNDYKAVYHFNDAAYTGTTYDGTANGGVATLTGFQPTDFITGKIGMAYNFGGTPSSPTVNSMTASAADVTTAFTESAWVMLTIAGNDQKIMTSQNASGLASGGYKLGVYTSNIPESEDGGDVNRTALPNPSTFSTGVWYYVQGVYNGTTLSTYVNGVQYKVLNSTKNITLSNTLYIGIGEGGTYPFSGTIDEPRVSNVAKTTDWLKMEYVDQNNPVAFTNVSSTYVTNVPNAATIPGALTYTWTGATSTDPTVATNWNNTTAGIANQAPALTGTATLVINAGAPNYPKLIGNASIYGMTIASGAALNLNGYTLSVGCHIYNSTGGQLLYGGNAASGITWNGSLPTQYYYGSTTAATGQTGNMTVNNSAAGTVNINTGNMDVYGTLTMTNGNLVITSPSVFTLKSLAAQTANVAAVPATSTITGIVTVERYLQGGSNYRSYRLMSSPVYNATVSSNNIYSLNYIQNSMFLTGLSGGGFDKTGNPTLYLYREDLTPSNVTFTSGNFLGISAINNTPAYNYFMNGGSTAYNLPAGSGYLCFFRGNRASASLAAKTTVGYVPTAVTLSTTGTLNIGAVTVHGWYTPASANLAYTVAGGNATVRGYNIVGNPYASAIDWSTFSSSSSSAGIYGPNVAPAIYEFDPVTKNYATYNAMTNIATGNGGKIISSGQGFFVQALTGSATLTFNESAKTSAQVSGTSLLMGTPVAGDAYASYMRLKLETDTINYSDMVIGLNAASLPVYNAREDSKFLQGMGSRQSVAAISSDSVAVAAKWLPFPKNKLNRVVRLSVNVKTNGVYTLKRTDFKAIPDLYEVWLMDKYKKDSLDIKHNTAYAFDVNLSDTTTFGNNRFSVVIRENPALGLHLLSFAAAKAAGGAQVSWKVENEANYTNFTVQRSTDGGVTFLTIGGYLSSSQGTYTFMDGHPASANQYRLKLDDVDGNITYSAIVPLMYANQLNAINNIMVYPNPSKSTINLSINGSSSQQVTAGLSNLQYLGSSASLAGQKVSANATAPQAVYNIKIISITGMVLKETTSASPNWQSNISDYTPGTYVIQVLNSKDNSLVGKSTFVKL